LGFAQTCIASTKKLTGKSIQAAFPMCYQYWKDKSVLINMIRADVFTDNYYSNDKQIKLVKEAMTALNFGARRSSHSYINHEGIYCKQALATIFKDSDECDRFLQCPSVADFVNEQKLLNKTIMKLAKANKPDLLSLPFLLTKKHKLKRQKTLAYLYQNEETRVMNIIRQYAESSNLTILANIHDAIIFKKRLTKQSLDAIHLDIHTQTNNSFWHLNQTKLQGTKTSRY
jgi:hypothetical protein